MKNSRIVKMMVGNRRMFVILEDVGGSVEVPHTVMRPFLYDSILEAEVAMGCFAADFTRNNKE